MYAILNNDTLKIGGWLITKIFEYYDDFGIQRRRVAWWKVRREFEADSRSRLFQTHKQALDYINKQDGKPLGREK